MGLRHLLLLDIWVWDKEQLHFQTITITVQENYMYVPYNVTDKFSSKYWHIHDKVFLSIII
jgi:hypothetical protein